MPRTEVPVNSDLGQLDTWGFHLDNRNVGGLGREGCRECGSAGSRVRQANDRRGCLGI